MRLRQLFEEAPAKKIVVVMPGGFHPFHPGHKSLYDWAVETFGKENVYAAATNDTKSRPFPFDVKIKLAQMAGVPTDKFIEVKSPFNALSYNNIIGDASQTALIFVRSEKDKTSHPLPDQVRKSDGNMGYLISFKGKDDLETADTHGYLAYGPTIDFNFSGMSIKSASELRAAWPDMSEEDKLQAADLMYPGNGETAAQLLNQALGVKEPEMAENIFAEQDAVKVDPKRVKAIAKAIDKYGFNRIIRVLKRDYTPEEFSAYMKAYKAFIKNNKKSVTESDVVIDPTQLRQYLRMLIDDAIDKEQDIAKLSKVLKILVGKEIKSRGKRYKITSDDIKEAISMKIQEITESKDLSYAIALAMQAKNLATGSVTGDEEMDVSVSLSPSAKKKMMQMKAQAEKISGMPFKKLVAMGEKQKAQDLIDIRSEFSENADADQMLKDFAKNYWDYKIWSDQGDSSAAMVKTNRQSNNKMKQLLAQQLQKAQQLEKQLIQMGMGDKVKAIKNQRPAKVDMSKISKDI